MSSRTLELRNTLVGVPAPASVEVGPRLAAAAIDFVAIGAIAVVAGLCAHVVLLVMPKAFLAREWAVLWTVSVAVAALYLVYFWGYEGATPGQKMLGLCVTSIRAIDEKPRIGIGRAVLRLIGFAAGSVLLVGLLVAILRWDRRAFHDLLADSVVVAR
jgi:uncharacterized RDD family membrane protein YckC